MTARGTPDRRTLTLIATILGSSVAFLDQFVVALALPTIEEDLDMSFAAQQAVVLSYSVTLLSLYLFAGAAGDRFGRRRIFIGGLIAFAATSALAGAAWNAETLILARALQGAAAAFVTTNSLALLRAIYGRESGRAIGLWTAFTSVTGIIGPAVGGAIVDQVSWRWIFYLNLPIGAAALGCALAGAREQRAEGARRSFDIPGALLALVTFASLAAGLLVVQEYFAQGGGANADNEAHTGLIVPCFVVALVALAAFLFVESRKQEPMLPLGLFRQRVFAAANLETFLIYAALQASFFYIALYLQFVGLSATTVGLFFIPGPVALFLLSGRVGKASDERGPRTFLIAGPALIGAGIALLIPISSESDVWTFGVASMLVFGVGLALMVAPITSTAISAAPSAQAGVASGVNTTVSRAGGLLAVAVVGLVMSAVFHGQVDAPEANPLAKDQQEAELRSASEDAFRAGMILAVVLAGGAAATAAIGLPRGRIEPR